MHRRHTLFQGQVYWRTSLFTRGGEDPGEAEQHKAGTRGAHIWTS